MAFTVLASAALFLLGSGRSRESFTVGELFCGEVNGFHGMVMRVKKLSVRPTKAEILIVNNSPAEIESGGAEDFCLQLERDGDWYELKRLFPDEESSVSYGYLKGVPMSMKLDWSACYGSLPAGHYRIVKRFSEYYGSAADAGFLLAAEFKI